MANKKRDDEKANWLIVGILFTAFLLGIDICYSSFPLMATIARSLLAVAHLVLAIMWAITMIKFNDPNYDYVRKCIVLMAVALSLIIGIHHGTAREDKQVIIDARENSLK